MWVDVFVGVVEQTNNHYHYPLSWVRLGWEFSNTLSVKISPPYSCSRVFPMHFHLAVNFLIGCDHPCTNQIEPDNQDQELPTGSLDRRPGWVHSNISKHFALTGSSTACADISCTSIYRHQLSQHVQILAVTAFADISCHNMCRYKLSQHVLILAVTAFADISCHNMCKYQHVTVCADISSNSICRYQL